MVLSMEETQSDLCFHRIPLSAILSTSNGKLNRSRETNQKTIVIILARDDSGLN